MEDKIDRWRRIADNWRKSGLSQRVFCQEQGVKLSTLHYWMKRIKDADGSPEDNQALVCISAPEMPSPPAHIILETKNGLRIILPQDFQTHDLEKILAVTG